MSDLLCMVDPVSSFVPYQSEWASQHVPIDPVLVEPLDLFGSRAQRRHQVEALARQLHLDHRLDRGCEESTWRLLFRMIEPLVDAREKVRIDVHQRASWITLGGEHVTVSISDAAQAVVDLGWSHETVHTAPALDALQEIRGIYVTQMTKRVKDMLRRWEKAGWVSDVGR